MAQKVEGCCLPGRGNGEQVEGNYDKYGMVWEGTTHTHSRVDKVDGRLHARKLAHTYTDSHARGVKSQDDDDAG